MLLFPFSLFISLLLLLHTDSALHNYTALLFFIPPLVKGDDNGDATYNEDGQCHGGTTTMHDCRRCGTPVATYRDDVDEVMQVTSASVASRQ